MSMVSFSTILSAALLLSWDLFNVAVFYFSLQSGRRGGVTSMTNSPIKRSCALIPCFKECAVIL